MYCSAPDTDLSDSLFTSPHEQPEQSCTRAPGRALRARHIREPARELGHASWIQADQICLTSRIQIPDSIFLIECPRTSHRCQMQKLGRLQCDSVRTCIEMNLVCTIQYFGEEPTVARADI